ncbi:hypothetical protein J1N35_042427 [Gossypium stocksii]|uniref:Uncharacterized protein n=1 Tax=Gossypium stocksii TaxID=47602 RepID=A0A9D3UHA2_9ROSI|nr:hypothetical protein J1N35_042427 [Gossypium stocksii]
MRVFSSSLIGSDPPPFIAGFDPYPMSVGTAFQTAAVSREVEIEEGDELFIGPPPPALVAEAESANEAESFEEVPNFTPYVVYSSLALSFVGRAINIAALSLSWNVEILPRGLLLPFGSSFILVILLYTGNCLFRCIQTKCPHPQAHQAFVILNKALKDLQGLDKAELQAMREAAQWIRLQGISMEGDDELLVHEVEVKVPPKRDEWMSRDYLEAYNAAAALASNEEENTKRMQIWWINIIKKND